MGPAGKRLEMEDLVMGKRWLTGFDGFEQIQAEIKTRSIDEKIEEKFGTNQCRRMHFVNDTTGEEVWTACNSRKCMYCGPRVVEKLRLQTVAAFDQYVHIETYKTRTEVDTTLERIRKDAYRHGDKLLYLVVGDDQLGFIVATSLPQRPGQHLKTLSEWMERITNMYRSAHSRMRRSRAIGRLSQVTRRMKDAIGTSPWRAVFTAHQYGLSTDTWDEILQQTLAKEESWLMDMARKMNPTPSRGAFRRPITG